jgi:cytochrome b6-f complex iron-sulfur subunit
MDYFSCSSFIYPTNNITNTKEVTPVDEKIERRDFFGTLINWILGLTVVSWIVPIVAYLFPKSKGEAENVFMDPLGNPIMASAVLEEESKTGLAFGDATVVINYGGELRAFSAVCTHLGCIVSWKKDEGIFLCPCHAGKFDPNGNVIAGPPPRPLPQYRVRIEEDKIELSKV